MTKMIDLRDNMQTELEEVNNLIRKCSDEVRVLEMEIRATEKRIAEIMSSGSMADYRRHNITPIEFLLLPELQKKLEQRINSLGTLIKSKIAILEFQSGRKNLRNHK